MKVIAFEKKSDSVIVFVSGNWCCNCTLVWSVSPTLVGLNALSVSLENRFTFLLSTGPAALYASALSPATLLSIALSDSVGHASAHATQRHSKWYLWWSLMRSPISVFEKTPEYAS